MEATKIAFLLFPKVHLQDLAGPAQVFFEASELGKAKYVTSFVSPLEKVTSSQGLAFLPQAKPMSISLKKGDMVCVPGFDFKSFVSGELDASMEMVRDWLWEQRKKGVFVSSICSGSLALGYLGLLDHIACTTHWKCLAYMRQQFPNAKVLDNRLYVLEKGVFTSAGMSAGIDMSLALLERWNSPLLAAKVAQEMVINMRREETQSQQNIFLDFKNHFNADVYRAQEILANHLEASFTLEDLSKSMNMSARHLSRLFKAHTGRTLQAYRDKLRTEHGEQLLLHTEMTVKEIASACGFADIRQFSRLWKLKKGITPLEFRKK